MFYKAVELAHQPERLALLWIVLSWLPGQNRGSWKFCLQPCSIFVKLCAKKLLSKSVSTTQRSCAVQQMCAGEGGIPLAPLVQGLGFSRSRKINLYWQLFKSSPTLNFTSCLFRLRWPQSLANTTGDFWKCSKLKGQVLHSSCKMLFFWPDSEDLADSQINIHSLDLPPSGWKCL